MNLDEIDINPIGGAEHRQEEWKTRFDLLRQFEESLKNGQDALRHTSDERLLNKMAIAFGRKVDDGADSL